MGQGAAQYVQQPQQTYVQQPTIAAMPTPSYAAPTTYGYGGVGSYAAPLTTSYGGYGGPLVVASLVGMVGAASLAVALVVLTTKPKHADERIRNGEQGPTLEQYLFQLQFGFGANPQLTV